jgi:hypothetical protein
MIGLSACLVIGCGGSGDGPSLVSRGGAAGGHDTAGGGAAGAGASSAQWNGIGGAYIFTDNFDYGGAGGAPAAEENLVAFRVEPSEALLQVSPGASKELAFHAFGKFASAPNVEVELTERSVFYVPDNYLVAGFPAAGTSTLSTRLPASPTDPVQRGGSVTVQAQAANSDGTISTATTTLTVQIAGELTPDPGAPEADPAIPADPGQHFVGTPTPSLAPLLAYPNDGVLMPPNLGRLEVHFQPGSPGNTLFEVHFQSSLTDLRYYTRCYSDPAQFEAGACALALDGDAYNYLATTNQGHGSVALSVRGSDENGNFGESDTVYVEFAEQRIDGAVYYWSATSPPSIMRFDFGGSSAVPEVFMAPSDVPDNNGSCVGCHALSRQGDKMFFSLGDSGKGQLMFVNDMARPSDDAQFFTYNGAAVDQELATPDQQNRVLTGSFNPIGDQFVAVAPKNDPLPETQLFFHDGDTGVRTGSVTLPFTASHPDWSPLGDSIALTKIGGTNSTTIEFIGGGISLLQSDGAGGWQGTPLDLVPPEAGKNRFNPAFVPDASLLLYSEVDQSTYTGLHTLACTSGDTRYCNGYSDPGAKTWAVAPTAGATPVLLANAAAPGIADGLFDTPQAGVGAHGLMDTFPKPAPFLTQHRGTNIGWFTVGSQRRAGLRKVTPNASVVGDLPSQALLWMFAIDPAQILDGQDGSRKGFFLPFQDLSTSNHMAQWTQRIVSDEESPPPPPVPPPPAPPPAPPPPSILH